MLCVGGAVKDDPFLGLARLIELPAAGRKVVPLSRDEELVALHRGGIVDGRVRQQDEPVDGAGFGFDGALERLGVERRVYALGERKGMLDPFRPERPEDVEVLRAMQEDIHDVFIEWVRERRGVRLKEEGNDLFSGRVWTGRQAVELGLADGLGEMRQVVRERFGKRVRLRVALRRRRRFPLLPALPGLADAVEERLLWARYGL